MARLAAGRPGEVARTGGAQLLRFAGSTPREVVRAVVRQAAAVCPNSVAELEHLAEYTALRPRASWTVVLNGLRVDELPPADEVLGPREDVVLSVGGVSPRKNTLGLMRAVAGLDCRVQLVGAPPRAGDRYAERVLAEAPPNVEFAGLLPREEVLRRLARAAAHVQPGFVETPGLASLEAAALGTPVAVADTAPVREYFRDVAHYADPRDPGSLRHAILAARAAAPSRASTLWIRERYDWDVVLDPLVDVVQSAGG